MKIIKIKNHNIIIDDEYYEIFSKRKWYIDTYGYAVWSFYPKGKGGQKINIKLHREVLNVPPRAHVDHINRNKLDNRLCNLRIVSRSANLHNSGKTKRNKSGFRGVFFEKGMKKPWNAQIMVNKKRYYLGNYKSAKQASIAYENKAKELNANQLALSL